MNAEPEEIIEAKLIAHLATTVNGVSIEGALAPALEGEVKTGDDTYINVAVDQTSQELDAHHGLAPMDFAVKVTVNVAFADDKSGTFFRDLCRLVRASLSALLGDECEGLNDEGFVVFAFMLNSTSTSLAGNEESASMRKVYNATLSGRTLTTTTSERAE